MRSRKTSIILALFFGWAGVHKFYLKQSFQGIFYLLFFWTLLPLAISLIDMIILLLMNDDEFNLKYNSEYKNDNTFENKSNHNVNDNKLKVEYSFMKNYSQWGKLSNDEKNIRLCDLEVIMNHGKDGITKELIKNNFPVGTKIIDITYFSGLTEHGFTIPSFLVQHTTGGEIREVSINIRLSTMEFIITHNSYHSSGKERYYYIKKNTIKTQ